MAAVSSLLRRGRYAWRSSIRTLRRQPALKILFIVMFFALFEIGLWLLFKDGLEFIDQLGAAGYMIVKRLFALFFTGLGAMLTVSAVVTSYASLYRSSEISFLLTSPYDHGHIVWYKFLESSYLCSWAFFFIIVPFVGAYAEHEGITLRFSLCTLAFSVPFLFTCSAVGTLLTMVLVRWAPRGRARRRTVTAVFLVIGLVFAWSVSGPPRQTVNGPDFVLSSLVPGLRFASSPFLPSWWTSEGIMSLADGRWRRGLMLMAVSSSNAMMLALAVEWLGRRTFFTAWERSVAGRSRRAGKALSFAGLERRLAFLPHDLRALVLKDVRTFCRDPAQWSQGLIFFGLLALYFANLRSFHYQALPREWRSLIAFLNVFGVAAVLCSLASRFVYPQLSLEGQGFWIIGLSPTSVTRVLLAKFALALLAVLTVSTGLIYLSSSMLSVEPRIKWLAVAVAAAIGCAVTGLSTGLGAVFIDLKARNPSAIVSGFGGTLNLVLSLGFMVAAILPFGLLFHARFLGRIDGRSMGQALLAGAVWLAVITAGATILPLYLGRRRLRRLEL